MAQMLQLLVILSICCVPLPQMPSCPLESPAVSRMSHVSEVVEAVTTHAHCMSTVVSETVNTIFERNVMCNMGAEGASLGAGLRF